MTPEERKRLARAIDAAVNSMNEARRILLADGIEPDPIVDPVAETEAMLRRCAEERGYRITPDGYVSEAAAAELLGRAYNTVRNWRSQHRPIPFRRFLGRIEYSLADLARFTIEAAEKDDGDRPNLPDTNW